MRVTPENRELCFVDRPGDKGGRVEEFLLRDTRLLRNGKRAKHHCQNCEETRSPRSGEQQRIHGRPPAGDVATPTETRRVRRKGYPDSSRRAGSLTLRLRSVFLS